MFRHLFICLVLFFLFTKATFVEKRQHEDDLEGDDDQQDPPLPPPDSSTTTYLNTSDESPTSINQDVYDIKKLFKHPPQVIDLNELIQIKLYCEVNTELCKHVENSVLSAASRLDKVLELRIKIIFQVSYYSFCLNKCANETYGWGSPSSQYTLNSLNVADSNFIYPQALAKQLAQFTDSSKWVDYDVAVELNHDMNQAPPPSKGGFWFNSTPSIEEDQVDIEYVILHQMMHGLGMVSSWAPYFSDTNSPFQKLLHGLIQPTDQLKMITPSPYWYITHNTGPTYITGFQPNLIFDKFLHLFFPATNQTTALMDYSFDMQDFCVPQDAAFIGYFIHSFLNNATQSTRAKSMYVAMLEPNTLSFSFGPTLVNSSFWTDPWLNGTYRSMLMTAGLDSSSHYRPGICTSHVADSYKGTPDFLMTDEYVKGVTLDGLIDEGYATVPTNITYNVTEILFLNVTSVQNVTVNNRTTWKNVTTVVQKEQTTRHIYRSAIGPGILRILETIGYSTVLTHTNYTASVVKSVKNQSLCDNFNGNNHNYQVIEDIAVYRQKSNANCISIYRPFFLFILVVIIFTFLT